MNRKLTRGFVAAAAVAAVLLAAPAESRACGFLDCLFGWCQPQTTYYAPAPAVAPACPTQTCGYVPQTTFRAVYRVAPVTTYRISTFRNPLTGGAVTTYRPVTRFGRQAQLVPTTAFRAVYSNPCVPAVSCNPCDPCAGGACAPAMSSPCGPGGCGAVSAPMTQAPAPSYATEADQGGAAPQTFQQNRPTTEAEDSSRDDEALPPIPEANYNSMPIPRLIHPENRTTMRDSRVERLFGLISSPPETTPVVPVSATQVDDGGWRASRD